MTWQRAVLGRAIARAAVERLEPRLLFQAVPTVSVTAPALPASENGPTARAFTLHRDGDITSSLVVRFLIGGKAKNGVDYSWVKPLVTFSPGRASARVTVQPFDDTLVEGTEAVTLTLVPDAAYQLGVESSATIRITDNDSASAPGSTAGATTTTTTGPNPNLVWSAGKNAPLSRAEGCTFVANGKMYMFGGFDSLSLQISNEMDAYNPVKNTWTRMADCPVKVNDCPVAVDPKTHTAWIGGFFLNTGVNASALVYKYDITHNVWSQGPSLPVPRGAGSMAIVGRELHYFSGLGSDLKGKTDHWRLDLNHPSRGWVKDTPIPDSCNHMGCVAYGTKIYAIGGLHDKLETSSNQSHVQVYDVTTRKWSTAAPMPVALGHIQPGTCLAGDFIVVAGGQMNAPNGKEVQSKYVLEFDIKTNKWSYLPSLPSPRMSVFAGFVGGKLIVSGGNIPAYPYLTAATLLG